MTISTTTNRKVYSANGSTSTFAYDYLVLDQTHLKVYLLVAGVLVPKALTTDYTVTGVGNPSGGNVVFVSNPAAGTANVVIQRVVPLTQLVDYITNDAFPADTHEGALDKLTMIVQQLNDSLGRSVGLPLNDTSGVSLQLPAAQALKFWRWDALAAAIEFVDIATLGAISVPVPLSQGGTGQAAGSAAALLAALNAAALNVAQSFTAVQTPKTGSASQSATGTFTFDPSTHGQVCTLTLTNAITCTLAAAAGKIVAGTHYTLILKAGDTSARTFAKGATVLAPAATLPITSGTITANAHDILHLVGVDANTVEVVGSAADVR